MIRDFIINLIQYIQWKLTIIYIVAVTPVADSITSSFVFIHPTIISITITIALMSDMIPNIYGHITDFVSNCYNIELIGLDERNIDLV